MEIRKIEAIEVLRQASEEIFQEGFTEAVKKAKHLLYKQSHLQRKIRIAESVIKKSQEKLDKTNAQIKQIESGDFGVLNQINMKEDFAKEDSELNETT